MVKEEIEEEKVESSSTNSRVLDDAIMQQIQGLAERFEKSVQLVVIQDPEKAENQQKC